jgi:hypothetical protein
MWICKHCHAENKDGYASCENCGANRSAGRFGSAPTLNTRQPAQQPPAGVPGYQPLHTYPENKPQERRMPPPGRCMQGMGKTVGWLLLILLPVLCALLAWRQYDVLSPVLVGLLLEDGAAQVWKVLCYVGFALAAVLLAMLPGLHTLLQCSKRPRKKKK